jgi:hypothetical protein
MEDFLNKTICDIVAEIDLPVGRIYYERYGTPEYWKALEKEMLHEVREFDDFIRDHRSRDEYGINIIKKYVLTCKFCGHEYPDEFNGIADCCEEAMTAQNIKEIVST